MGNVFAETNSAVARLRNLPEWQQDALIVASSVAAGILMYSIGMSPLYVTGVADLAPGWLRPTLFTAICLVELLRRRAPAFALAVGCALVAVDCFFGVSVPMLTVFADLLYAATLYGSRRLSKDMIPMAAMGAVGAVVAALIFAPGWRETVLACLVVLPFVMIPVWWAAKIRQHREIADAERTNAAQVVRIGALDRTAAVAAERARMARDLHDVIAGDLSAIAIQSEAALSARGDLETAWTVLAAVRESSVRALTEMRAMIGLLRADGEAQDEAAAPARLADLGKLIASARVSGMEIEVRIELDESVPVPAAVDLTAYRIAQEALTNAMKHAPRSTAKVEIRHVDGTLTVEVANALTVQPWTTGDTGTGLLNMRERAVAVGGSFFAGPSETGWLVRAVLPAAVVSA
jgi:signal transduction histidine kinase